MSAGNSDVPFLIGADFAERRNVAWRVELGRPDERNPLIAPKMPWDDGVSFMHGTVLRDPTDGSWKAWGTAAPNDTFDRRLVYYESADGLEWQRPELDIVPFGDHEHTNILLDFDSGGTLTYANVFVVEDAPESHRFQMYCLRRPEEPDERRYPIPVAGFQASDGSEPLQRGVYRYHSSDGVHWEPDVGPVLVNDPDQLRPDGTSDSFFIYRGAGGGHVMYHKTGIEGLPGSPTGGCRILVRRTSDDGVQWSPHEPCLIPDWRDPADTQFMEMSVTPMSGGFVGLVTVYRTTSETLELQFSASRDGRHWWRPDRRACVPIPPLGDYGGGMMWGTHQMIGDGEYVHYYYGGMQGIHDDMLSTEEVELAARRGRPHRNFKPLRGEVISRAPSELRQHGALCRATWRRGRLWALTTASGGNVEGSATTAATLHEGDAVHVNAHALEGGELLAELVGDDGDPAPGFGYEQCDPFTGNSLRARISWRGNSESPAEGLRARFILRRARLYGFEFRAGSD